ALIPQGLVLLVSMAMAVAVIRLGQRNVVVQELPAVEGLARIDVLCVDKTGTLTTGNLTVEQVRALGSSDQPDRANHPENEVRAGLAALSGLEAARSSTMDAIRSSLAEEDPGWPVESVVPFSSVRKWSSATFAEEGTWFLGAPEILLDAMQTDTSAIEAELRPLVDQALRVLLVARANREPGVDAELPSDLRAVGLVALSEELRPDAADTIDYFRRQHVDVKIVSGDNPRTVAAVAERLGIESTAIDLRSVDDGSAIATDASVFGRVRPEQKRDLVRHLQAAGHTVAMTGDGVNDIPSLKAADIGIAMNTATPATKATAQLVLLDGRFERLPGVVSEGRRVIANMERVSSLFATKTVYAAVLALVFGALGTTFPFLPRHLTVVATITIGIPAFVLSFRSSDEPCRPGYLRRVLHFAVPAGLTASVSTIAVFLIARSSLTDATLAEARTVATSTLTITGLWILYRLIRPLDRLEAGLLVGLVFAFAATLAVPMTAELYALDLPPVPLAAVAVLGVIATLAVLELALAFTGRWHREGVDS
ncbi:MAG: HAD-IC family P-type ATPase, partial [Acidimicrobiales bacterium]